MGILNVTPDSFYDGGEFSLENMMEKQVDKMVAEGADIIDVGGVSTRPYADKVNSAEEWRRVKSALEYIRKSYPEVLVSLDTTNGFVLKNALQIGVDIVNDISFGKYDEDFLDLVALSGCPYILMHMQGDPQNMQDNPNYNKINMDVLGFFAKAKRYLNERGINDIIIDPGFGFGKTINNNYEMLRHLSSYRIFNDPILIGLSRKSMIYKLLETDASEVLSSTSALNLFGLIQGANILRVHDVKEAKQLISLKNALYPLD